MSHYEKRLEADLWKIRDSLSTISSQIESALKNAIQALLSGDDKLAYSVMLGDRPINRAVRRLDKMCHSFIALHLPSAGHLRFISSVMRVGIALERIGDYSVTICRQAVQLVRPPHEILARELELMADQARQILNKALTAFLTSNADMAKTTISMCDQTARIFDAAFESLANSEGDWTKKELFALLVVCNMLLRVSDQAKNLCEETIFAVTGESKDPGVYRILFIDEDNSCLGQMAEAIARKNFPHCGEFSSAGRVAAGALNPHLVPFMEKRGIDMSAAAPKQLNTDPSFLGLHYVIVSLQGPVKSYMQAVPFHSIAQEWEVGEPPAPDATPEEAEEALESIYREIAPLVHDLIEKLRGVKAPCRVAS